MVSEQNPDVEDELSDEAVIIRGIALALATFSFGMANMSSSPTTPASPRTIMTVADLFVDYIRTGNH